MGKKTAIIGIFFTLFGSVSLAETNEPFEYTSSVSKFLQAHLKPNSIWLAKFKKIEYTFIGIDETKANNSSTDELSTTETLKLLPDGTIDYSIGFPELATKGLDATLKLQTFANLFTIKPCGSDDVTCTKISNLDLTYLPEVLAEGEKLIFRPRHQVANFKGKKELVESLSEICVVGEKYNASKIHEVLKGKATKLICRNGLDFETSRYGREMAYLEDYGFALTTVYDGAYGHKTYKYLTFQIE